MADSPPVIEIDPDAVDPAAGPEAVSPAGPVAGTATEGMPSAPRGSAPEDASEAAAVQCVLMEALGAEIEAETDPGRLALLHVERGYALLATDAARAAAAFSEALALDPRSGPAASAMEQHLRAGEQWGPLLDLLNQRLDGEGDDRCRAEMLLEKGWLLQHSLGRPADAKDAFWAAHRAEPEGWLTPLLALERLAAAEADWDCLARVYEGISQTSDDPDRQAVALRALARLQPKLGEDSSRKQIALLKRAADLSLDRAASLAQLELVAEEHGLHGDRVEALQGLAREIEDAGESSACLVEAARLARHELDDAARAQALLEEALALQPDDAVVRHELISVAEQQGDARRLTELLEERLAGVETPDLRASLSFRIALAHLDGKDGDAAAAAIERSFAAVPGYLPALMELERAALAASDYGRLVDVWVAQASSQAGAGGQGQRHRVQTLWRAAVLAHTRLGNPDRAAELCQQALDLDPDCDPVADLLEEVLQRDRRFEDQAALLEQRQDRAESAAAKGILERLAQLYAGPLGDPARAASALGRLLALKPSSVRTARRLVDALEQVGDHDAEEQALVALEKLEDSTPSRVECLLRRAELLVNHLGRAEEALGLYREVLSVQPANTYALIAAEGLLGDISEWAALAQLFEAAAAQCGCDVERGMLLLRAAQLHAEALDQGDAALNRYQEATDSGSVAFYAATKLSGPNAARSPEQRAVSLETARSAAPTPLMAQNVGIALGQLYECMPAHRPRVIELAGEVSRGARPGSLTWVVALQMIADTHRAAQRWGDALDAVTRLAEHAPSELTGHLLQQRAWLADMAGDAGTAAQLWQQLHDGHPGDPGGAWARLWHAARANDPMQQAALCGDLADRTDDSALGVALDLRRATLSQCAGAEEPNADSLWRVLAEYPDNLEAGLALLAHSQTDAGQRTELLALLAGQVQAKHHGQLGLLLAQAHEAAGRPTAAITQLQQILDIDANHLPALLIVQRLSAASGQRETEARVWMRIGSLLQDDDGRTMAYRRAGALFDVLSQPGNAAVAYRQALAIAPRDPDLHVRLAEAYRDARDHGQLEQLLTGELATCEDAQRQIALLFERSALRADELNAPRDAASDLMRILDIDPHNSAALNTLALLFQRHGDLARAADCYQRLIESSSDPEAQRPAVGQLAALFVRQDRPLEAAALWEQYVQTAPGDAPALQQLAQVCIDAGDTDRAARAYEQLVALPADRRQRIERQREFARFQVLRQCDPIAACRTLLHGLDTDNSSLPLLGDLRKICIEGGTTETLRQPVARAKAALRETIGGSPLVAHKYDDLLRLAEWSQDRHTAIASLGVLCCLGAATEQAQQLYRRCMETLEFAPKGQILARSWRGTLMPPETRGGISGVWRIVAEAVPKLHADAMAPDLSLLARSRPDTAIQRAAGLVGQVASLLNVEDFVLHVATDVADVVRAVVSDAPTLVLGGDVAVARGAAQRFRLGRALALLRDRTASLEALTLDQVQLIVGGAVQLVNPEVLVGGAPAEVREYAKALQRVLSRKAKRALPLAVNQLLQEGANLDIDGWRHGALLTAHKAALLACGDIVVALQQIVPDFKGYERQSRDATVALLAKYPTALQLLPFSVSRQCIALRREHRL